MHLWLRVCRLCRFVEDLSKLHKGFATVAGLGMLREISTLRSVGIVSSSSTWEFPEIWGTKLWGPYKDP